MSCLQRLFGRDCVYNVLNYLHAAGLGVFFEFYLSIVFSLFIASDEHNIFK